MGENKAYRQVDKQMMIRKSSKHQKQEMTGITTYISVITLSVNGLNSPNKRHIMVG
jgi:hypothetical protein